MNIIDQHEAGMFDEELVEQALDKIAEQLTADDICMESATLENGQIEARCTIQLDVSFIAKLGGCVDDRE